MGANLAFYNDSERPATTDWNYVFAYNWRGYKSALPTERPTISGLTRRERERERERGASIE